MRSLIVLSLAALMIAGCGAQEYKSRPQEDVFSSPSTPTTRTNFTPFNGNAPRGVLESNLNEKGYVWKGLQWSGVSAATIEDLHCSYGDSGYIRKMDAFGTALTFGAVTGVLIRAGEGFFFGEKIDHTNGGHGHGDGHGDGGDHVVAKRRTMVTAVREAFGEGFRAAVGGAVMTGACQIALSGTTFLSYDGLLGRDFEGMSSAIVAGGVAGMVAHPYIKALMNSAKARAAKKATAAQTAQPEAAPAPAEDAWDSADTTEQPDIPGFAPAGPPAKPPGRFARLYQGAKDWSASQKGFARGVWYRLGSHAMVLGVSSGVGILVYDQLEDFGASDAYAPVNCSSNRTTVSR